VREGEGAEGWWEKVSFIVCCVVPFYWVEFGGMV
jgi:hypothetical protein